VVRLLCQPDRCSKRKGDPIKSRPKNLFLETVRNRIKRLLLLVNPYLPFTFRFLLVEPTGVVESEDEMTQFLICLGFAGGLLAAALCLLWYLGDMA
jgi:hypothetical protein